ncbi:helix-turn-helix domain-containing protein [bacterium]|nr:helix-turn-helix domain-containing protein [bacterium]
MNAETKIIKHKLSVLELAEALSNVSSACRLGCVSRTHFYDNKQRFQTLGIAGLRDLPPIVKHHPNTTRMNL